jgi:hypothetical protein
MRDTPNQMQNRSFATKTVASVTHSSTPKAVAAPKPNDDLTRIFNTVLVSSQASEKRDFSSELYELTDSASFQAILSAVKQLARVQGIQEKQAAEQVIHTFRKLDEVWNKYLFREGIDRMRQPRN